MICLNIVAGDNLFPPYEGGIQGGLDQSHGSLRSKNLPQPLLRKEGRKRVIFTSMQPNNVRCYWGLYVAAKLP